MSHTENFQIPKWGLGFRVLALEVVTKKLLFRGGEERGGAGILGLVVSFVYSPPPPPTRSSWSVVHGWCTVEGWAVGFSDFMVHDGFRVWGSGFWVEVYTSLLGFPLSLCGSWWVYCSGLVGGFPFSGWFWGKRSGFEGYHGGGGRECGAQAQIAF